MKNKKCVGWLANVLKNTQDGGVLQEREKGSFYGKEGLLRRLELLVLPLTPLLVLLLFFAYLEGHKEGFIA